MSLKFSNNYEKSVMFPMFIVWEIDSRDGIKNWLRQLLVDYNVLNYSGKIGNYLYLTDLIRRCGYEIVDLEVIKTGFEFEYKFSLKK